MKNSDCLLTSIAIMKCTGVWMPDDLQPRSKYVYMFFGFLIQSILFVFIVLAEISYVYTVRDDTERAVDAAVLLLSHLVQGAKVGTICCRQGRIKRLIQFIDGPLFTKSEPSKRAILYESVRRIILIGNLIISAAAVTAVFWCIVPKLKPEVTLPLKIVYPFDINGPIIFSIMYAYSSISVVVVGVGDAAENYMVSALMALACTQLDMLSRDLKFEAEGKSVNYRRTVSCVKYHQNIIEYVDELAAIFGFPILCQFIASSVIVCMTLFKITVTTHYIELMTMVFYLNCVFLELFMYCYPGQLLIGKSLLVSEAAYPNNWTGDIRCKRALFLTALRAQKPLMVNAGSVFRVSLPTALGVVQTAYSYYAVLTQKISR